MKQALRIGIVLIFVQVFWLFQKADAQNYCYPTFKNGCSSLSATEFQLGTYLRTSSCSNSAGIDTSKAASSVIDLYRGYTYLFRGKSSTKANLALFFDANDDGDFNDGGETVGTESNFGSYDSLRTYLVIGKKVKLGTRRVRLLVTDGGTPLSVGSACTDFSSTSGSGDGEMEDYLVNVTAYNKDAYLAGLADPVNNGCANSSQAIKLIIQNFGLNTLTSIPVTVKITTPGGTTTTYTSTLSKSLSADAIDTFTMSSTVNMSTTGTYKIVAYTTLSGDQDNSNDSLNLSINITPSVSNPSTAGADMCGYGVALLKAASTTKGAKTFWYNRKTADSVIAIGDYFTTDTLKKDTMFYAQSEYQITRHIETTKYIADRSNVGSFIDIYAKNDIVIDSFDVHLDAGTHTMELYYRKGSYLGHETSSTGWVYAGSATITSYGTGSGTLYPVGGFSIPAGQTYGVLLINDANHMRYTVGSTYLSNGDITVTGATTTGGKFSSSNLTTGRTFDGGVYYHPRGCRSGLVTVKARVRAGIPGVSFKKGSPYKGFFNAGNSFNPDNVCPRDTIVYELTNPNNFTNADYGKKWIIAKVAVVTSAHDTLSDTLTQYPTATSNFKIRVVPPAKYADTSIYIRIVAFSLVDSCVLNLTRQIDVSTLPQANFGFNEVCVGQETTFFDSTVRHGATVFYTWDFGDGGTATQSYPTHTYASAGTYDVKLTVTTGAGCSDFITKQVHVYAKPQIGFSTSALCLNELVSFLDTTKTAGKVTKYYWEFGDGSKSFLAAPTHTYKKTGKYTVVLGMTVSTGCIDTLRRVIEIVNKPKASFTFNGKCIGETSTFTNTSTGDSNMTYYWDFGDNTYSTDKNPSKLFYTGGGTTVTLTVKAGASGCSSSYSATVAPFAPPKAKIGFVPACAGSPAQFYDSSDYVASFGTRLWKFGSDTTTSRQGTPTHIYTTAGTYKVTLWIQNSNGCVDSAERSIVITAPPKANFTASTPCAGMPMNFTNTSTSGTGSPSYEWTFGDGSSTATDKEPQHVYTTAGQYTVSLKVKSGSCVDVKTLTVTVNSNPVPTWKGSATGRKVTFTPDDQTYKSYTWYFNNNADSSTNMVASYVFPSSTGSYDVRLRVVDNNGCVGENTVPWVFTGIFDPGMTNKWNVNVYPNPFTGATRVSYTLEKRSMVRLSVFDLEGREVAVVKEGSSENAGKHEVSIDASSMPAGVYVLRVIVGDQCYNTRIIQLK